MYALFLVYQGLVCYFAFIFDDMAYLMGVWLVLLHLRNWSVLERTLNLFPHFYRRLDFSSLSLLYGNVGDLFLEYLYSEWLQWEVYNMFFF